LLVVLVVDMGQAHLEKVLVAAALVDFLLERELL
jgi:hypothetical protein